MNNEFFFKPDKEYRIISLTMLIFGLLLFLISILYIGEEFILKMKTFIVVYLFIISILFVGALIYVGYLIEKKNYVIVTNERISIYNGFNKLSYLINFSDIKEIIYCKNRKKARRYWDKIDIRQRPYGFFKNDQVIISLQNSPIIQHYKYDDPGYILLFLEKPNSFLKYVEKRGIKIKIVE